MSKFSDENVIAFPEPRIPARSRFADEIFEMTPPVVLPARSKFADDAPPEYPEFSVSWAIQWFIEAMNGRDGKRAVKEGGLGESHQCTLERIQRAAIGGKDARELTEEDIIAHCEMRRETVAPATINQDITYLHGALKYVRAAPGGCRTIKASVIKDVKPFLVANGYISKSTPRWQRPTPEEIALLVAYFGRPAYRENKKRIDMATMTLWQLRSGRRVGESCALLWEDWNREEHTILVRKMKDPKRRNKQKVVAIPEAAQAMLEVRWETRDPSEPRIFPFRKKSVSAAYTKAKKVLAELHPGLFLDLRLHDSRRDCYTRLVEDDGFSLEEAIMVTGHETIAIPQRTYFKPKPERFKLGPKAKRLAA